MLVLDELDGIGWNTYDKYGSIRKRPLFSSFPYKLGGAAGMARGGILMGGGSLAL